MQSTIPLSAAAAVLLQRVSHIAAGSRSAAQTAMDLASAPPSALAEPSAPLMEQLVDAVERGLSERGQECLDALVGSAQALSLRDTSPAAMLVAALSATAAAQAREDEEGQVYDLAQQVEAQAAAAAALLDGLGATLAELERSAARAAVEAETHRHKAPEELAKVAKYRAQQAQHAANLEALGYDSKLSHGSLRALGQRHAQLAGELAAAEAATTRYAGLPADMGAARAAHQERLQELERLRERLAAGLAGL